MHGYIPSIYIDRIVKEIINDAYEGRKMYNRKTFFILLMVSITIFCILVFLLVNCGELCSCV